MFDSIKQPKSNKTALFYQFLSEFTMFYLLITLNLSDRIDLLNTLLK